MEHIDAKLAVEEGPEEVIVVKEEGSEEKENRGSRTRRQPLCVKE